MLDSVCLLLGLAGDRLARRPTASCADLPAAGLRAATRRRR